MSTAQLVSISLPKKVFRQVIIELYTEQIHFLG